MQDLFICVIDRGSCLHAIHSPTLFQIVVAHFHAQQGIQSRRSCNSKLCRRLSYTYTLKKAQYAPKIYADCIVASGEGAVRQAPKIKRFWLLKSLVDGLPEYCRGRV